MYEIYVTDHTAAPSGSSWPKRCKYQASYSKCFRICTNPFQIHETL